MVLSHDNCQENCQGIIFISLYYLYIIFILSLYCKNYLYIIFILSWYYLYIIFLPQKLSFYYLYIIIIPQKLSLYYLYIIFILSLYFIILSLYWNSVKSIFCQSCYPENWVSKNHLVICLFLTLKIFIMDGGGGWMDGWNHFSSFCF